MRLYYEAPGVQLWCGDFREAPAVLGERRFSLVLADPPYGQTSAAWDRWPDGWLATARALLAPDGSLWCWGTLRTFMEYAHEFTRAGWRLAQDCVWEKHNGSAPASNRRFPRVHEQVAHFYPEDVTWSSVHCEPQRVPAPPEHAHKKGRVVHRAAATPHTGIFAPSTYVDDGTRLQRSVWPARSMHRQGAGHVTPKPLEVLEPSVRYSCPSGGAVLVPFAGSGQEMIAAIRNGRNVTAFETDESACANAVARVRAAQSHVSTPSVASAPAACVTSAFGDVSE